MKFNLLYLLMGTLALGSCCINETSTWAPAGDNIKTRWAKDVTPSCVHSEYPRPQMVRNEWKSLNGLWDYSVERVEGKNSEGKILVPFCIESSLSGVCERIAEGDVLRYRTEFSVPSKWMKERLMLNFQAVDWKAVVKVNGQEVGTHTGGYTAFSYDITPYLVKGGKQVLEVEVTDGTDNDFQPRGKQVKNPRSIWYTPVSGIWQSVWLEPVPSSRIESCLAISDIDAGTISISVNGTGLLEGDYYLVSLFEGDELTKVATSDGKSPAVFRLDNPKLWSPDRPYLYNYQVSLVRGKDNIDTVNGYTAMRKISTLKDKDGIWRLALNNEALFQYGPLDQGWWPDGLYTAPSDEAMRYDLAVTRDCGFNMIRKHIKVEPATWYRACDEMGILVWQDMPSFADNEKCFWSQSLNAFDKGTDWPVTEEIKANYFKEWAEIIDELKVFPCIVMWVPFNEAWGQFETLKAVEFTKAQDPTRLVNGASGGNWVTGEMGDVLDSHHYPDPQMRVIDVNMVNVLGEYGGIGLPLEGHTWNIESKWGYVKFGTAEEATDKYVSFAKALIPLQKDGRCSAAVYTQTTDVEGEVNGIMTYDREVTKLDPSRLREVNTEVIKSMTK